MQCQLHQMPLWAALSYFELFQTCSISWAWALGARPWLRLTMGAWFQHGVLDLKVLTSQDISRRLSKLRATAPERRDVQRFCQSLSARSELKDTKLVTQASWKSDSRLSELGWWLTLSLSSLQREATALWSHRRGLRSALKQLLLLDSWTSCESAWNCPPFAGMVQSQRVKKTVGDC